VDPGPLALDLAGGLDASRDRGLHRARHQFSVALGTDRRGLGDARRDRRRRRRPSTPGFIGPFHLAAKVALLRFGVAPETAVACGTVIHAVMWVTITGLGLLVLRLRRTSLEEVDQAAGGS
jgi:hypothetical protein